MASGGSFVRTWLERLAASTQGAVAAVVMLQRQTSDALIAAGKWPTHLPLDRSLEPAARAAVERKAPVIARIKRPEPAMAGGDDRAGQPESLGATVAVPILSSGRCLGAVAMRVRETPERSAQQIASELQRNVAVLPSLLSESTLNQAVANAELAVSLDASLQASGYVPSAAVPVAAVPVASAVAAHVASRDETPAPPAARSPSNKPMPSARAAKPSAAARKAPAEPPVRPGDPGLLFHDTQASFEMPFADGDAPAPTEIKAPPPAISSAMSPASQARAAKPATRLMAPKALARQDAGPATAATKPGVANPASSNAAAANPGSTKLAATKPAVAPAAKSRAAQSAAGLAAASGLAPSASERTAGAGTVIQAEGLRGKSQPGAHSYANADPDSAARTDASQAALIMRLFAAALSLPHLKEAGAALAAELASALHCDRVSLGLREAGKARGVTRVVALSHAIDLDEQQGLMATLAAAMDEAIDQGAAVSVSLGRHGRINEPGQALDARGQPLALVRHAHQQMLDKFARRAVLSVPMAHDGEVFGAITLERGDDQGFDPALIDTLEHAAALLGPLLRLQREADRSWWAHGRAAFHQQLRKVFGPGHPVFKAVVALIVAVVAVGSLVQVDHNLRVPARLEGVVQRVQVAPSDGFVKAALVRPGDTVKAGQVLVQLEDRELQLEARKWQGEIAQIEAEYGEALARQDRTKGGILMAKLTQARAQLDLVNEQLARAEIRAPFDGVVIKGDLTQQLGAPVKRGDALVTVAPDLRHRVILDIDERDIGAIQVGQQARLALASAPSQDLPLSVARITPVATTRSGRNIFEVEAKMESSGSEGSGAQQLRPGLEGIAKVAIGDRRLIWIWTHRIVDWVMLRL